MKILLVFLTVLLILPALYAVSCTENADCQTEEFCNINHLLLF